MSQPLVPVSKRLYDSLLRSLGWYGLAFIPLLVLALVSGLVRDVISPMLAVVLVLPGAIGALVLVDAGGKLRPYIEPRSGRQNVTAALVVAALLLPVALQVAATVVVFDIGWLLALLDLGVSLESLLTDIGLLDPALQGIAGQPAAVERVMVSLVVLLCLAPVLIGGTVAVLLAGTLRFGTVESGKLEATAAPVARPVAEAFERQRRHPTPEEHAAAMRAFRRRLSARKAG